MRLLIAILFLACAVPAAPADIRSVEVKRDGKRYFVESDAYFDAPAEAVFDVLTDYDRFERISSVFKESRFIKRDASRNGVVYTLARGCVLFFCKSIERTERLEVDPPTIIRAAVIPERSDLKFGEASWLLTESPEGTRVRYRLEMEPKFWVPPLIGPYIVKRTLHKGGVDAANRIERLARESK